MLKFKTKLFNIGSSTILLLPQEASAKLPSRGMTLVKGTINDIPFTMPLEPDGRGSHWLKVDKDMGTADDIVGVAIEPAKAWPEPEVPTDLKKALAKDSKANTIWKEITPMARWDWLRWIASTGKSETRTRRIDATLSKMKGGTRRPCCFNRSLCTDMSVSKGGALLEPAHAT